ncbi:MAG TPA: hypothetical protein VML54_01885, partial [Candidatus Limnocylindrales bacterium]|nr:hypothetical protein [Candidatus Limnocylindrales bacterium]
AALAMRRDDPPRRMTTAPEIKALAQQIGPIAARFGIDSAVTARAVAALVTMCHPVVLACMLANAPMGRDGVPPRRKRGRR